MRAFHNDPNVKAFYTARVQQHKEMDQIVQGTYWRNGKGCAVGCTIHGEKHKDYENALGIPRLIAQFEDAIFESLPNAQAKDWPTCFLTVIPVGADLSQVAAEFAAWLLTDPEQGLAAQAPKDRAMAEEIAAFLLAGNIVGAKGRVPHAMHTVGMVATDEIVAASSAPHDDYIASELRSGFFRIKDGWAEPGWEEADDEPESSPRMIEFANAAASKLLDLLANAPVPEEVGA